MILFIMWLLSCLTLFLGLIWGIFSYLKMIEKWNQIIEEEDEDGWIHIPAEKDRNEGVNHDINL